MVTVLAPIPQSSYEKERYNKVASIRFSCQQSMTYMYPVTDAGRDVVDSVTYGTSSVQRALDNACIK